MPSKQVSLVGKVPKPPERLRQLPVGLPSRPDMEPSTRKWVDDVRVLAEQATMIAVATKDTIQAAKEHRKVVDHQVSDSMVTVDAEARRRVDKANGVLKKVRACNAALVAELLELLKVRQKAVERVASVEKPLRDLYRRIEYRTQQIPASEVDCQHIDRELRASAAVLQRAVDQLQCECTIAERHVAKMQELREALDHDTEERERAVALDEAFVRSEAAGSHRSGEASSSARSLAGPSIKPLRTLSPTAVSGTALPPINNRSPRTIGGRNRPLAVAEFEKIAGLSAHANTESAALRVRLRNASKAVDAAVAKNHDLVETSVNQTLHDAKALRKIVRDRLDMLHGELATLDGQRDRVRRDLEELQGPLADAWQKTTARKASKGATKVMDVDANDPLTAASERESSKLKIAVTQRAGQLRALDDQRARMVAVMEQLCAQLDAKNRLIAVDERVLQIGSTPRSMSVASSARSARSITPRSQRG